MRDDERGWRSLLNAVVFTQLARRAVMRKRQFGQWLLHSPFHPLYLALRPSSRAEDPYRRWIAAREAVLPSAEWHCTRAQSFAWKPVISIIMPVCNPRREWLEAAVDSVRAQSYPHWQLCVCDDASDDCWAAEYLNGLASGDPRIRAMRSDTRLGISGALNAAGSLASGDFVLFLDHDDLLHRYALHYVAEACQDREVEIVYSDHDFLDESGYRADPQFKPDWSPDLLLGCMYFGHLFAVRSQSVERAGWFRSECDGAQDYDLALRLTSKPVRVRHIPLVLYHWRRHAGSTAASSGAKPYTHAAGRRALEDAVKQRGIASDIEDGPVPNTYYVRRKVGGCPPVSVIVHSRDPKRLRRFLRSVDEHTAYRNREVIIVQTESIPKISGAMVVFINEDVRAIHADWLDRLIAHLERKEVGVVGAKLVYPPGAIQHAGVVVGMAGGAGHAGRGIFASNAWPWLDMTREVSAVSGACLAMRTSVFEELKGFDESLPAQYRAVDLCLRGSQAGYLIVYEPRAVLQHAMDDSDGAECSIGGSPFHQRWAAVLNAPDPYYSPALDRTSEDIRLC